MILHLKIHSFQFDNGIIYKRGKMMRRWVIIIFSALLLVGCQSKVEPKGNERLSKSDFDWNKTYLGMEAMDVSNDSYLDIFKETYEEGKQLGYTPFLVEVSPTLEEAVKMEKENHGSYKKMHKQLIKEAQSINMLEYFEKEAKTDENYASWLKQKSATTSYEAYSEITLLADTIYIVKVDSDKVYDVFAYLPIGGFNDCLTSTQLLATFKLWYEEFKIIPVSIGYDNVQLYFSESLDDKQIETFAKQMYFVDNEVIGYGYPSLEDLEKGIKNSSCWSLWWD